MHTHHHRTLLPAVLLTLSACFAPGADDGTKTSVTSGESIPQYWHSFQPDLPISEPPFRQVHANWKQRIDQPYVYVDYEGSYLETGRLLPLVHQAMRDQGLEPSGAPFALYYDDPGRVAVERLRSRACVPVEGPVPVRGALEFDVLPSTTVVYAFAAGAYPEVPRCYPGLYSYMQTMGWVEAGPIRETYLVAPSAVLEFGELLTEVQIPVTYAP